MTKKAQKGAKKMPRPEQVKLKALILSLKQSGPVQPSFWHYSKLGDDRYHCHLSLHWVACWTCENGITKIEVYYAGSREKAPY